MCIRDSLGREPSVDERAENLGMPRKRVTELLQASGATVSLETPVGDEDGSSLGDFVADDSNESTEDKAESFLLREEIDEMLAGQMCIRDRCRRMPATFPRGLE